MTADHINTDMIQQIVKSILLANVEDADPRTRDWTPDKDSTYENLCERLNYEGDPETLYPIFDREYNKITDSVWWIDVIRERQYELWCEDMNEEYQRREYATEKGKIARKYG